MTTLPASGYDVRFIVDGTLDESVMLPTVQQITGRPPRAFARWARDHADAFR
ncbi:hypothetical protein [Streptomyces sp. LUP47B]|uniref:hypothetical protein n=1 Tax=Streptomyces sp. LUP47B TaxID=1890286 RepID=UPI00159F1D5F|nr:hypothetical protein [Streptomyces sp. LUP47B]